MHNVYIVGAYLPNGGTLMAYHLGMVVSAVFGLNPVAVSVEGEERSRKSFSYSRNIESVSFDELRKLATKNDFLVVNPSFSAYQFGASLPCVKICYIQGFNTFSVLDGFFDLYVTASDPLQDLMYRIYRLKTEVIPPFIDIPSALPSTWATRRPSFFVPSKGQFTHLLYEKVLRSLETKGVDASLVFQDRKVNHEDFLHILATHRYVLTLSQCEGFGLIPLEAMARGCAVVGFDGVGGRHYMRDEHNGLFAAYPDIDGLVEKVRTIHEDEQLSAKLAQNAMATAEEYTVGHFYDRWRRLLEATF